MMGLDDFLIGIITNGIVAWLADKDAKIDDAQRKRLEELIARIERSRTSPDKLRGLAAQSLRDACAKSPDLQSAADAIMSDPALARELTLWLLEPDPEKYDAGKTQMAGMLCDRFGCDRPTVHALLSSLEQGINADLQLGQLRGHNEHRLILRALHEQTDWQARIERDNAYMVAMLERLLAKRALPGARPLQPQPRHWRKGNSLLSGSKPRLEDIDEGLDFKRNIQDRVMSAIRSAEPPALFAFLADQQMGKTTFLLRVGSELAKEGYPVLQLDASHQGLAYVDWITCHSDDFKRVPPILLLDDPRNGGKNFVRQMNTMYDRSVRAIILVAENRHEWEGEKLDQNPLCKKGYDFGLLNAYGEALELVKHLERQGAIHIASEWRDKLLRKIRNIDGRPGYFQEVIRVASDEHYKPISLQVRDRLTQAGQSPASKAFIQLYTLVCVPGAVGLAVPENVIAATMSLPDRSLAMNFNNEMPNPPILCADEGFRVTHERHAQEFLGIRKDGEVIR